MFPMCGSQYQDDLFKYATKITDSKVGAFFKGRDLFNVVVKQKSWQWWIILLPNTKCWVEIMMCCRSIALTPFLRTSWKHLIYIWLTNLHRVLAYGSKWGLDSIGTYGFEVVWRRYSPGISNCNKCIGMKQTSPMSSSQLCLSFSVAHL